MDGAQSESEVELRNEAYANVLAADCDILYYIDLVSGTTTLLKGDADALRFQNVFAATTLETLFANFKRYYVDSVILEEDRDAVLAVMNPENMRRTFVDNLSLSVTYRVRRNLVDPVFTTMRVIRARVENGRSASIVVTFKIVENAMRQELLRKREEQLTLELLNATTWRMKVGPDGYAESFRYIGGDCRLGIPPGTSISLADFRAHVHPNDRESLSRAFRAACDDPLGRVPFSHECRFSPDGVCYRWIRVSARTFHDGGGGLTGAFGVLKDVNDAYENAHLVAELANATDIERMNFETLEKAILALQSKESLEDLRPFLKLVQNRFGSVSCYLTHFDFDLRRVFVNDRWSVGEVMARARHSRTMEQHEFSDPMLDATERKVIVFSREELLSVSRVWGVERDAAEKGVCRHYSLAIYVSGKLWGDLNLSFDHPCELDERTLENLRHLAEVLEVAISRIDHHAALQAALNDARVAERTKSTFLATMSHEIRTPLNAVVGFAEFLQSHDLTAEERANYLGGITESSNALLALINDILDLSKIEAGKMDMKGGRCDLAKVCSEMRTIFRFQLERKRLEFRCESDADLPVVRLREERLRQILLNLIGNAVKFTAKGYVSSAVRFVPYRHSDDVPVRREDIDVPGNGAVFGMLTIRVSDTGPGIPRSKFQSIFDPFAQDGSVRGGNVYHGTGLGLSICRRLVESVGGTITVESSVGVGTTFRVMFPNVEVDAEGTASRPAAASVECASSSQCSCAGKALPHQGALCVVLVDDVPMNLLIERKFVEMAGVPRDAIRTFSGARAAIEFLASQANNSSRDSNRDRVVVMTDLWMPQMSGVDLARAIRDGAAGDAMRTIALVAVTADADSSVSFDMSAFDSVITKPLTGARIKDLLVDLLRGK